MKCLTLDFLRIIRTSVYSVHARDAGSSLIIFKSKKPAQSAGIIPFSLLEFKLALCRVGGAGCLHESTYVACAKSSVIRKREFSVLAEP